MAGAEVKHDYHLVNPSPWPLAGSIAATLMMIGAVAWMKSGAGEPGLFGVRGPWLFSLGLAGGIIAPMAVLPFAFNIFLTALELLVAFLQAYVFAILSCIYLHDALHPAH